MTPTPIEESHAELTALGERMRKHDAETAAIDRDLAAAIQRARKARLPMQEIANTVGVERTTLYSVLNRAMTQATKGRPGPLRPNTTQN